MTEDEMVGWPNWLNAHEQASGDGEGQKSLVCYSPLGCKESDTAEQQLIIQLNFGESLFSLYTIS